MKCCPYCKAEIADDASKCRYCGEWVDRPTTPPAGRQADARQVTVKLELGESYYKLTRVGWIVFLIAMIVILSGSILVMRFARDSIEQRQKKVEQRQQQRGELRNWHGFNRGFCRAANALNPVLYPTAAGGLTGRRKAQARTV